MLVRQWTDCGELAASEPVVVSSRKQWHEVRLFISSTFTDYFAEREVIVKQVRRSTSHSSLQCLT